MSRPFFKNERFVEAARTHPEARFFAMDEARIGLKTWHRRRWCPKGFRPPWVVEDRYEWLWLYAAVEPTTGASFCLYLPRLDGDCFAVFLSELARAYPNEELVLVVDGAPGHRSTQVTWPEGIEPLRLPPYSPELNPAERLFAEVRRDLANRIYETVEAIMDALTAVLRPYWETPAALAQLTGYGWWLVGVGNNATES